MKDLDRRIEDLQEQGVDRETASKKAARDMGLSGMNRRRRREKIRTVEPINGIYYDSTVFYGERAVVVSCTDGVRVTVWQDLDAAKAHAASVQRQAFAVQCRVVLK